MSIKLAVFLYLRALCSINCIFEFISSSIPMCKFSNNVIEDNIMVFWVHGDLCNITELF